ncbi:carboxymuconolactone decarboxylase family protein [Paenibacillus sp. N3/727]|uniref:carboxymuconolactone decarboxylase family protein n=1 Tax=Paenibacillus sp. N3/727 TaxID=2925845 RepID=UPI001F53866D|nr:carboxymuconolactone decarboxylase family protein [Paenibacillus sp. N3/727]UNK18785.1 carboxymuconolactone decarboxylase family protein [Paenibacillus sp. N3/727]
MRICKISEQGRELAPKAAQSFLAFENEVYHELNTIPLKTKELIALAVAHVTGCPYCIDTHVKKFKALGGTREEAFEAVLVATSTRAGAILSHATHALASFDDSPNTQDGGGETDSRDTPSCFC